MKKRTYQEGTHRHFLALALPLTLATITTPVLGAVDTAVVGYLDSPHYLGGVAVAALIFNTLYWLFGFLRVSTSGFTAQAAGRSSALDMNILFARPLLLAALIGSLFILFQIPIKEAAFAFIQPPAQVAEQAEAYFSFRIWGAPFALMQYVVIGWLVGSSKVNIALLLQLGANILNMGLDVLFVFYIDMGSAGVGLATLIAEVTAAAAGLSYVLWKIGMPFSFFHSGILWKKEPLLHMLRVNRDLFIRTICLLGVFAWFTSSGAAFGEVTLAANAILFQIHFIMTYFFDGLSNAGSITSGRAIGRQDKLLLHRAVKIGMGWSAAVAFFITMVMLAAGPFIVGWFTSIDEVQAAAVEYSSWIIWFPAAGFAGLQLYGIFIGATQTAPVRNSLIYSMIVFFAVLGIAKPILGNDGLWLAFILFSLSRSLVLTAYVPRLLRVSIKKA